MKYTYHLFGVDGDPSLLCPESVALFWVLNSQANNISQYEVVFSNNTDLSPIKELPLLIVDSHISDKHIEYHAGFNDIIQYLIKNNQFKGNTSLSLDIIAALEFLTTEFKYMTLYQLYLNKKNYTNYTRKQFSKLFYWPAWYTAPLQIRSKVRDICNQTLQLEYLPIDDEELQEISANKEEDATVEDELTQSKSLKLSQITKRNKLEELKSFKHHLQYCTKLCELIDSWQELKTNIQVDPQTLQILETYFTSNFYIQISLPEGDSILKYLKRNLQEQEVSIITDKIAHYSYLDNKLTIREPSFSEQGNMAMSLYHKVKAYTA